MGKTARMLAAPSGANLNLRRGRERHAYDPAVWVRREEGDYLNVRTGELCEAEEFDFDRDVASELFHPDDWDLPMRDLAAEPV